MTVSNNNRCDHGPGLCINIECTPLCPANPCAGDAARLVRERLEIAHRQDDVN